MKSQLCCLLNPYVVCIKCLAPICETCSGDDSFTHKHFNEGCLGLWYPIYHEAVTNPETRKKYLDILAVSRLG